MEIPKLIKHPLTTWPILPEGIHPASLSMIQKEFAINDHRNVLFSGLVEAAKWFFFSGCKFLYINGSYVTGNPYPNDYDVCWDPDGVVSEKLFPLFRYHGDVHSVCQKIYFYGEFYPITGSSGETILDFFQYTREEVRKGIVQVSIAHDPMLQAFAKYR